MPNDFYRTLYTSENLHAAWRHVRKSAQQSKNRDIRNAAEEYEIQAHKRLKSIQSRLVAGTYKFPAAEGVLKDKKKRAKEGKDPRPIVVSTLEGRVVQRAILQTLQPKDDHPLYPKLGLIKAINESAYGIGGIPSPYGGVAVGIRYVLRDMNEGLHLFFKSDIQAFFTRIQHDAVINFVRAQTKDNKLAHIFAAGLNVELGNKEKLAEYFDLFPQDGVGVAQGSSLSAFAGNVLLYELDQELNSKGVRAYRYIDDLIIFGKDNTSVQQARSFAIQWLKKKGMSLYDPAKEPNKAEEGHIRNGFTYLGCRVTHNQVEPSASSRQNLLTKIKKEVSDAKINISSLAENPELKRRGESAYIQALARIDKIVYGWGKSFSFCNNRLPFQTLDRDSSKMIGEFEEWFLNKKKLLSAVQQRRAQGVTLLQDIESTYSEVAYEQDGKVAAE